MAKVVRGLFFEGYRTLVVALCLLGACILYKWTLPFWSERVTGTVESRTPADDPHKNPAVTYKYPLPDGRWSSARGHEPEEFRNKFTSGASVVVLRSPIWPYWAALEASTRHTRHRWSVIAMIFGGVLVVAVVIRQADRWTAKLMPEVEGGGEGGPPEQ